jgi:two-component system invasion response regulator UvrY
MVKVLLADDHSIVRAGLRRLIEESGDMTVIAEAADGRDALRAVENALPDVAVIDLSMPGLDGLEVISRLHAEYPSLPLLVLTMHEEGQYVVRAVEAGAMGYITKQSAPEQLVNAIRKVIGGSRFLTDEAVEALALRAVRICSIRFPCASSRCCADLPWVPPTARSPPCTASASKPSIPTAFES